MPKKKKAGPGGADCGAEERRLRKNRVDCGAKARRGRIPRALLIYRLAARQADPITPANPVNPCAAWRCQSAARAAPTLALEIPTAEEIFDRPLAPITPLDYPDSPAWQIADQECARLIANALYEPPITEEEIDHYARRFGLSRREAEAEIRRVRYVD